MLPERDPAPADAELQALLADPVLRGRWPDGMTTDDVLDALIALGKIAIDVREEADYTRPMPPRFACRLELRDGGTGAVFGQGHTLTAATLRCLIEAEAELAAAVERGLDALGDLLGER